MPHVMPLADARARAEKVAYLRAVAGLSWSRIRDELGFTSVGAWRSRRRSPQRHTRAQSDTEGMAHRWHKRC